MNWGPSTSNNSGGTSACRCDQGLKQSPRRDTTSSPHFRWRPGAECRSVSRRSPGSAEFYVPHFRPKALDHGPGVIGLGDVVQQRTDAMGTGLAGSGPALPRWSGAAEHRCRFPFPVVAADPFGGLASVLGHGLHAPKTWLNARLGGTWACRCSENRRESREGKQPAGALSAAHCSTTDVICSTIAAGLRIAHAPGSGARGRRTLAGGSARTTGRDGIWRIARRGGGAG